MVATKMVPTNKRRGGFNNGMPGRPRFKPGGPKAMNARNMGAMFNANQLGDNPGFVDFNDDVQIPSTSATPANTTTAAANNGTGKGPARKAANSNHKRVNVKNGAGMRRMPPGGMGGHWGPPMPPMPPMFPMGGGRRNGPPPPPPHFRMPPMGMRGMRGGPMMPPPPPNGRFGGPPMGPMGMMPRPMPPMPPMRGPMMNPMGRMMPPPMRGPQMRRNPNGKLPPGRLGKGPKGAVPRGPPVNGKVVKTIGKKIKPKVPAKPKEEYPLDKPWVTEEIKAEHDKKVELAERLKGNKDDALFAQFKEQRDIFVKMYEAARLEFIGKHPEQDVEKILTESVAANKAKANNESQKSNDAVSTDTPAATKSSTTTSATATASSTDSAAGAAKSAASSA